MDIQDWSVTAASNTDVDGTDINEGCDPANVNNAIRAVMANIAALRDLVGGANVTAGTADAQTLTTGLSLAAYQQGLPLAFEAGATNTGAMTIDVDAIGARSVKQVDGSDPPAGAVTAGGIYLLAYETNADVLLLLNPTPVSAGIADVVDDATPQLGGNLDLNGNDITGTGNISITGDVTLTGAFTSAGIDDNATGERLDLSDTVAQWGDGAAGEIWTHYLRGGVTDGQHRFSGGSAGTLGGNIILYGEAHSTQAGDILVRSSAANLLHWDQSAPWWRFFQPVKMDDDLTVDGAFTSLGIDDNASGKRVDIGDSNLTIGPAGATQYNVVRNSTAGLLVVSGGSIAGAGANLALWGESHSGRAGDWALRDDSTEIMAWDSSASQLLLRQQAVLGAGVATTQYSLVNSVGDGELQIAGGTTVGAGANFRLFGGSHATLAYDWAIRAGTTNVLYWDQSTSLLTLTGGLTLTGAFTSVGIDDNATGERLQIGDTLAAVGAAGVGYNITHAADDVSLIVSGGDDGGSGANFVLYGGTHATRASDFEFRADTTVIWDWDESASELTLTEDFLLRAGVFVDERAAARPDIAGYGQFWVKDNTPNNPMFTDDAGTDFQLATLAGTETLTNKTLGPASLSGELSAADNLLTRALLKDYGEEVSALGSGGGTRTFDITNGNVFTVTVSTSANTFAFTNPTATGDACSLTLIITNGGSQTVNWPASVDWAGGSAPSLTASGIDVVTLFTLNAGTTWYGFAAGLDMN